MSSLLTKFSDSILRWRQLSHRISRVSLYSTEASSISSDTLFRRLQRCCEQRISIVPTLDQWVVEGRPVHHEELKGIVKNFRKKSCFIHALEIVEWAINRKYFDTTPSYAALRLNLISRVHGVEQAESYFYNLEGSSLDLPVYGALLNCYAQAKSVDKAEAFMEDIRKLNSSDAGVYNIMLNLYHRMRKYGKQDSLVQEMEEKGIHFNEFTYNIRLNAYATRSNIEGMEKLLLKMEADPQVTIDICTCVTVAKGYIKAGALENASEVLKKCEHLIGRQNRSSDYGVLSTVYATMKKKEDVYRIWNLLSKDGNLLSKDGNLHNGIYINIMTSLERLDDLDGVKMIFEEWEEKSGNFLIQIPNLLIRAYCKRDRVKEAELILNRIVESGNKPNARTWSCLASGYCKNGMMEKAVDAMKRALAAAGLSEWKPNPTLVACLEYLKRKGDADELQEMLMLLKQHGKFSAEFRERIESYLCNGKSNCGET